MKKRAIITLVLLALWLLSLAVVYSNAGYYKELAGAGNVRVVDEVTVTTISLTAPNEVLVGVANNVSTEAGYPYKVTLFLNFKETGSGTMTWAAGVAPGSEKLVRFTEVGRDVSVIGVEVTK